MSSALVEEMYNQHHAWLSSWLRCRTGCDQVAADLAQDTFVRLLNKTQLKEQQNSRAYLKTIADGLWIDLWRRRQVEQAWLETLSVLPEAQVPSPEVHHIVLEALCAVDHMLSQLPENVANAFIMSQIYGLTYKQIAEKIGVSDRMIKKYMAQAMLHCALLEDEFNEDI